MYQLKEPFWQLVDLWQTLIAGGLALLAGIVTVWGTLKAANRQVKAANDAADREIKAANEAADRQIAAAQEQTKAAQHQTAVEAARKLPPPSPSEVARGNPQTREAYIIRQRVKRAGFAELRNAFLRFGGTRTTEFLQLDKEIEDFGAQWMQTYSPTSGFPTQPIGTNAGIYEQLDHIEQQAKELCNHAVGGMKLCRDELAKELVEEPL